MTIFSVGISGLNAANTGLLTTSHNISNASTPGYNRQEIVQGTNVPLLSGSGYVGQGTNVQTVRRIYDQFLGRQVLSAETALAEMETYSNQIEQLDNLLADPSAGLSPVMADFFRGVQDVAANPSSIPGRQSLLAAAQAMAARFQSIDQRMSEIREGINSQIQGKVAEINTYASQLADINDRIIRAQAGSQTQVPNDLLDQREQMLKGLNQLIRVTTLTQSDGSFSVFFGNGQPLVIGSQSYDLAAVASTTDPEKIEVALMSVGGTTMRIPESQITGGALGGLVAFRTESLDGAQNALGRIAITLARNFNDQHQLGMDLTGALGTSFFTASSPTIKANSGNSATPAVTGSPTVTIDGPTISQLTDSDYRLDYNGAFVLTRLSDNTQTTISAVPQVVDGMSIDTTNWAAGAVNGDSFLIQPTRFGARNIALAFSDARMVAAAAPIRTSANLANTGTASVDAGVVGDTTDLPLGGTVTLTYNAGTNQFVATGPLAVGPFSYTSGQPILIDGDANGTGVTIVISGKPADGDVFTIANNANGVSDNRNAQLLGALQTAKKMLYAGIPPTGAETASYQSAYSQIVSTVGSKSNEVVAVGKAQQGLVDHATEAVQSMSGVNLDEEAANLLRYQQAYQASAKILATASKVFDEILALGR